jgi:hypothetical protein
MAGSVGFGWEEALSDGMGRMIKKVDKGGHRRDYSPTLV